MRYNHINQITEQEIKTLLKQKSQREESEIHAERQGLFVIKATGSSASIINKKDFKPKAFS